jgi:hypothetical protein
MAFLYRGSFDHIPILSEPSSSDFIKWETSMRTAFMAEGLWPHLSDEKSDEFSPWKCLEEPVRPTFRSNPQEIAKYKEWHLDDAKIKLILETRCSPTVRSLFPTDIKVTAKQLWEHLAQLFLNRDYEMKTILDKRLDTIKLTDPREYLNYLSEFASAATLLTRVHIHPDWTRMIKQMVKGLPDDNEEWEEFHELCEKRQKQWEESRDHSKDEIPLMMMELIANECVRLINSTPAKN